MTSRELERGNNRRRLTTSNHSNATQPNFNERSSTGNMYQQNNMSGQEHLAYKKNIFKESFQGNPLRKSQYKEPIIKGGIIYDKLPQPDKGKIELIMMNQKHNLLTNDDLRKSKVESMSQSQLNQSGISNRRLALPVSMMNSGMHNLNNSMLSSDSLNLNESNFSNFKQLNEKLEIKPNIKTLSAYKQHITRGLPPEDQSRAQNGLEITNEAYKNQLNSPQNVVLVQQPSAMKNPVIVSNQRITNPEIEIKPLKEDTSLMNRDLDNPEKIKKRRRRSLIKQRRQQQAEGATVQQSQWCNMNRRGTQQVGAYRPDGSNRYGRDRAVTYEDDKLNQSGGCILI